MISRRTFLGSIAGGAIGMALPWNFFSKKKGTDKPNIILCMADDMQGRTIRRVLRGKTPKNWRTSMYYRYYGYPAVHSVKRHYGVRTQRYKLIHFYHDIDEWELYDLRKDPREMKNVYDDAAYADIVKDLKAELKRLRTKFKDTG